MITLKQITNTYDKFIEKYQINKLFEKQTAIDTYKKSFISFENLFIKKISLLAFITTPFVFLLNYFYHFMSFMDHITIGPYITITILLTMSFTVFLIIICMSVFGVFKDIKFSPYQMHLDKLRYNKIASEKEFSSLFKSKETQIEFLQILNYLETQSHSSKISEFKTNLINSFINNEYINSITLFESFYEHMNSYKISIEQEEETKQVNIHLLKQHNEYEQSLQKFINHPEIEKEYEINEDTVSTSKKFDLKTIL